MGTELTEADLMDLIASMTFVCLVIEKTQSLIAPSSWTVHDITSFIWLRSDFRKLRTSF